LLLTLFLIFNGNGGISLDTEKEKKNQLQFSRTNT
jgi:hypothetical protein